MLSIESALRQSRESIERLFGEIVLADDSASRTRHFQQLRDVLRASMAFEEQVIYPTLSRYDSTAAFLVKVALGDHFEITLLLDRAEQTESRSVEFSETLFDLQEAVDEHLQREEDEILFFIDRMLDPADAARLARRQVAFVSEQGRPP